MRNPPTYKGYYKELKMLGAGRKEKISYMEYWIKHKNDSSMDIRFYTRWDNKDELIDGWECVRMADKEAYEEHVLMRFINRPRTRTEKAIVKSQISGLKHIDEIFTRWCRNGMDRES